MTRRETDGQRPLQRRVFSGVMWSASARGLTLVIQTAGTVLLARLLSPADFGLFAITMVFVGFGGIVAHLGLGNALIQRRDLTPSHLSTAFWLNLAVGLFLTATLAAVAPLIANAFGQPELTGLVRLVALSFSLQLSVVPMALLERELRFRLIAMVETTALGAGLLAAVLGAIAGLGAFALALQALVSATGLSVLALAAARWWPRATPSRRSLGDLWSVSGWLTAGSVIGYWSQNTDTLLLGATQQPAQLGYYNRAYNLLLLPLQSMGSVVTRVIVPALATMQTENERSRDAWLRSTGLLALVSFPTCVGIAAGAPALVETLWGQQWLPVIPLLQVLALAGVPWIIAVAAEWLLFARGRARRYFWLALANTAITVVAVVAGLPWGPLGVAVGMLVRSFLILPMYVRFCVHEIDVTGLDVLRVCRRPLLAAAVMGLAVVVVGVVVDGSRPLFELAAQVAVGVVVYLVAVAAGQPEVLADLRNLLQRGGSEPLGATEAEEVVGPHGPGARPEP